MPYLKLNTHSRQDKVIICCSRTIQTCSIIAKFLNFVTNYLYLELNKVTLWRFSEPTTEQVAILWFFKWIQYSGGWNLKIRIVREESTSSGSLTINTKNFYTLEFTSTQPRRYLGAQELWLRPTMDWLLAC